MRYAVLSDIHGNLEALTAVLDALAAARIDRTLCLGDTVGYGADPAACLERLDAMGAVMVAGNHETGCVGRLALDWFNEIARAALVWTREQLSVAALERLRRLPLTTIEGPCTLVHGTLVHPERFDYLLDAQQALQTLEACSTLLCLVGHTHVPSACEYDRVAGCVRPTPCDVTAGDLSSRQTRGDASRRSHRAWDRQVFARATNRAAISWGERSESLRFLFNPGSVGQPRDGDPRASFGIIDTDAHQLSLSRVPYDVATAQQKIRRAGLPEVLAERLASGR